MFKSMKLSIKIRAAFVVMTGFLVANVLFVRCETAKSSTITSRVIDLRGPTLQTSLQLENGMNWSLAALRGWIILGADKFKTQRKAAWDEQIDASLAVMTKLSEHWTDPENVQRLARIKERLGHFKTYQKEIEDIAQSAENTPASKILTSEAAPLAATLAANITKIIDIEQKLAGTPARKNLLGMMADVRGTTGLGLAALRAYLWSGDKKFKQRFNQLWAKNERRYRDLSASAGLLNADQTAAFAQFSKARTAFSPLAGKMFTIREGVDWNLANRWLETKAAPTAGKIVADVKGMVGSQRALADKDSKAAAAGIASLQTLLWALLAAGLLFGAVIGYWLSRMITKPLHALVESAKGIAAGDVNQTVECDSQDEIGVLADAFRALADGQRELARAATAIGNGDLSVVVTPRSDADALSGAMLSMQRNMQSLLDDVHALTAAAVDGRTSLRADTASHDGQFAKILEGMNATLDAVTAPIDSAADCLARLANYDLTARVTGDFSGDHARIKDSVNQTANVLSDALNQVSAAAQQARAASGQIAAGSQAVAQGASEQASSLEETSSSLEEMTGMTKQTADNTRQAKAIADSTKDSARVGNEAMANLTTAMKKIHAAAEGTAAIIGDINEIAVQTNLLALNAAVEAARAGDAGRGFAVVAEEVRNLALRSKEAAKKTEELIKESVDLAREGGDISSEVSASLQGIFASAGKVADIVNEISVASEEQARGISQVNRAVAEMDRVVQQAAASSEETSSAAEELAGQSQELAAMVGRFELGGKGGGGGGFTVQAPPARPRLVKPPTVRPAKAAASSNGSNGKKSLVAVPEQLIPFDDEDDFAEF